MGKIKPTRLKMDERMHNGPAKIDKLANSASVFDDIDVIADKKIRDAVYTILSQALEIGLRFKITLVVTDHLPTNGKDMRRVLNEAHTIAYFPRSADALNKHLLAPYVGLNNKHIQYLKKLSTRAVAIFKNYPGVYMSEHEVGLLMLDDDGEEEEGCGGGGLR